MVLFTRMIILSFKVQDFTDGGQRGVLGCAKSLCASMVDVVFVDKLIRLCIFGGCCIIVDVISLVLSVVHFSTAAQNFRWSTLFARGWFTFNASIHSGDGVAKGHAIVLMITFTVVFTILPFLFSNHLLHVTAILIGSLDNFFNIIMIIDLTFLIRILFFLIHSLLKVSLLL